MKKVLTLLFLSLYSIYSYGFFDFGDEHVLDGVKVKRLINLQQLSQAAKLQNKPILLEFSAEYCAFCIKLENEVLKPMIRSKDYENKIFMRSIYIDLSDKIIGWDGKPITAEKLASKYSVYVTPTVIIIDHTGVEIAERQVGINVVDYYSQYLDIEIDKAVSKMKLPK